MHDQNGINIPILKHLNNIYVAYVCIYIHVPSPMTTLVTVAIQESPEAYRNEIYNFDSI